MKVIVSLKILYLLQKKKKKIRDDNRKGIFTFNLQVKKKKKEKKKACLKCVLNFIICLKTFVFKI